MVQKQFMSLEKVQTGFSLTEKKNNTTCHQHKSLANFENAKITHSQSKN